MDEYLFIALAKLRADRLKLEREARVEGFGRRVPEGEAELSQEHHSPRARRVDPASHRFQENSLGEPSCIP